MALQPFLDLGRFFSFLIYTQSVGLFEQENRQSQGVYPEAEQTYTDIYASSGIQNLETQCLNGRRQFMP
jgi:hypothetical protein